MKNGAWNKNCMLFDCNGSSLCGEQSLAWHVLQFLVPKILTCRVRVNERHITMWHSVMCAAAGADVGVCVCSVHSFVLYNVQCTRLIHNGSCLFDENLYLAKQKRYAMAFWLKNWCVHPFHLLRKNQPNIQIHTHTHKHTYTFIYAPTYGQDKRTTEQTNEDEIKRRGKKHKNMKQIIRKISHGTWDFEYFG